ncbi:serine proteinase inhibitor 1 [BeAn 58058 virus]|nr:serine proteinase inhibitor 1 [BeAn 58058 virus]APG58383.1 serine proteinase inhibitor 1 [BeAn 58058 virus]
MYSIENFKMWYSILCVKRIDLYIPKFKIKKYRTI